MSAASICPLDESNRSVTGSFVAQFQLLRPIFVQSSSILLLKGRSRVALLFTPQRHLKRSSFDRDLVVCRLTVKFDWKPNVSLGQLAHPDLGRVVRVEVWRDVQLLVPDYDLNPVLAHQRRAELTRETPVLVQSDRLQNTSFNE